MKNWRGLDLKYLWHPFTQQTEWAEDSRRFPMVISSGKGIYLYDDKGKRYMDGVSSLWCNLHGHQKPALNIAIRQQLQKIAHSTFLGLTHEPGILLAQKLKVLLPGGLSRFFYSDNGSTAVEVALKMAYQFHLQNGHEKPLFLALKNSYHGDTLGSVSVGGIALFHKKFKPLLFKTHFAMAPDCLPCPFRKVSAEKLRYVRYRYQGENPKPGDLRPETKCRWECLKSVETLLKKKPAIGAAILEPVVQGASGIKVMPPGYLRGFANLCRSQGVLLIADEVAVGFGRTGKMFACEHEGIEPDLLCLAKSITGGYLPLALTCATEKIYKAFLGHYDEFKAFFHGHTYSANPLACAAAIANLQILKQEETLKKANTLAEETRDQLEDFLNHPSVGQVRQAGLMIGLELFQDKKRLKPYPVSWRMGRRVCLKARSFGLLLRPLGDTVVLLPPLSIRKYQFKKMIQGLKKALDLLV